MSSIQELLEQAQLAEAAYASFLSSSGAVLTDTDSVAAALQGEDFSFSQAAAFVEQWQVVDQYTAPPAILGVGGTGFSATLFQSVETGAYTLAIRGTELGYADLAADVGNIAADESIQVATNPDPIDPSAIAYRYALMALNPFAVTGVDYQVLHDANGELDCYDPQICEGNFTQQWNPTSLWLKQLLEETIGVHP